MCDDSAVGRTSGYIALDWDLTTLQLKYQSALERVSSFMVGLHSVLHSLSLHFVLPSSPACGS